MNFKGVEFDSFTYSNYGETATIRNYRKFKNLNPSNSLIFPSFALVQKLMHWCGRFVNRQLNAMRKAMNIDGRFSYYQNSKRMIIPLIDMLFSIEFNQKKN